MTPRPHAAEVANLKDCVLCVCVFVCVCVCVCIRLTENGESACERGRDKEGGGASGLETEGNNSGTCTGNTSIFSTSPQRAKQKHELNDFGRGEWE